MTVMLDARARDDLCELRLTRSPWHVRAQRDHEIVVDSRRALLVWEPRRVTPVYAVPEADVLGALEAIGTPRPLTSAEAARPVLDPSVPFDAHTAHGEVLRIRTAGGGEVPGFRFEDPTLDGMVAVAFAGLTWFEEGTEQVAHPRDPYHRVDVRPTPAHVVMTLDDDVIVDTVRARLLAETMLPLRWYVPAEDVRVPVEPSGTTTACAYKGRATYRSARTGDRLVEDLFWIYDEPLSDGRDVRGLLGVHAERLDVVVDGALQPRRGLLGP